MKYLFLLLFSISAFAQPIAIRIEKITAFDSINRRSFAIAFSIENISDKPVSFLLNPDAFTPAHAGPLSNAVFYKIYENEQEIIASNVLSYRIPTDKNGLQVRFRDYSKMTSEDIENMKLDQQKSLYNSRITLAPREKRTYSKELLWNYERYQKQDDNEYYLDPVQPHYIELMLIFWREEYETKLNADQFAAIMADESIIKGWFVSNKTAIDFSEKKLD